MAKSKKSVFKRVIVCILIIAILAGVGTGLYFGISAISEKKLLKSFTFQQFEYNKDGDVIYFLNTGHSDAMLLQSNGQFAMVDAAEDSDNPRGFSGLELKGYEEFIIDFLKEIAGDENGKVHLDFVIGTHSHSDHIGGFDSIILDPDITVDRAYLKEYNADIINSYERNRWDNQEVYDQMVSACRYRDITLIQDTEILNQGAQLGNMKIEFFNTEYKKNVTVGENENTLVTLVTVHDYKTLLTGDINNKVKDEQRIGKQVGKIDILKVAHHGALFSTTRKFLRAVKPELSIVTNSIKSMAQPIKANLISHKVPYYGTVDHNGIAIEFTPDRYVLYQNIHN